METNVNSSNSTNSNEKEEHEQLEEFVEQVPLIPVAKRASHATATLPNSMTPLMNPMVANPVIQATPSIPFIPPQMYSTVTDPRCALCQRPILESAATLYLNKLYHTMCLSFPTFVPVMVATPDQPKSMISQQQVATVAHPLPPNVITNTSQFLWRVTSQPARSQIANYNVFPTPEVELDMRMPAPHSTVQACLTVATNGIIIQGGFKAGDVQAILPSAKTVKFYGLKLARLSHLKKVLAEYRIQATECSYVVQFSSGNCKLCTEPFKIVSSYALLPEDIQAIRPYKRQTMTPKEPVTKDGVTKDGVEQVAIDGPLSDDKTKTINKKPKKS